MNSHMDIDFFDDEGVEDVLIDILIDQLHKYADLENENTTELANLIT
ncbi:hypothetical protein PSSM7_211 [Prochlorococcus phage P-SSM7]|uniref:Uncharacterized protein n=1 Tax=Prochlorococcus phage P-SSM7 TaxID=445688 RepID=E3SNX5_9CAUD|nr:hypothetical protein PSSM7_211 [Prochlorococcus phage P-SSM7]ADO98896.1 hypothetical protein PSSM7_211 [Prochlorococcus phage P-SSM7]